MRHSLISLIALGTLAFSAATFAADAPAPAASAPMRHHGPSQPAIDACAGKAEGTAVSWTGKRGKARTGSCKTVNGVMAAHGPRHARAPGAAASAPR